MRTCKSTDLPLYRISQRKIAPDRSVYVHTTVATSTRNIKAILISVNDTLIKE